MEELIKTNLREIEEKENVKILHCVESGSRAWGFASPDSDYDVRFIYVRPKEFYLRLDKTRDVIEWQLDDTLDINGWDISKALSLLYKSNPTLFEWNSSPIVYKTTQEWEPIRQSSTNILLQNRVCTTTSAQPNITIENTLEAKLCGLKSIFTCFVLCWLANGFWRKGHLRPCYLAT